MTAQAAQTTDTSDGPVVAWRITMYETQESMGGDVDAYLNAEKTTSGFPQRRQAAPRRPRETPRPGPVIQVRRRDRRPYSLP
jgi:hypothetical protein